jgi:hypothetical protein
MPTLSLAASATTSWPRKEPLCDTAYVRINYVSLRASLDGSFPA